MPLTPAFEKQGQVDLGEFKDSLVYTVSFRKARAIEWDPVSKKKGKK